MKSKNMPKSTNPSKIIKWVSRLNEIERNGGGQFVSMNRVYKDKSKYNRNDKKKELRNNLNSYFLFTHDLNCLSYVMVLNQLA